MVKMQKNIDINGRTVTYDFERKKVKNINLRIRSNGSISVSACPNTDESLVEDFLKSKGKFICSALDRCALKRPGGDFEPRQFEDGDIFYYLGRPHTIVLLQHTRSCVVADSGQLFLYTRTPDSLTARRRAVDKWMEQQCADIIGDACERLFTPFRKLGVAFPKTAYRNMKARWGSCAPERGTVTFNKHLIEHPLECIEYVVVHEFAHLVYPDHSKQFYLLLSQIMPDWKERKQLLNEG